MKTFARRAAALLLDTPLAWMALSFGVYFFYAQFIVMIAWDALELVIAQHVIDHGAYVTSLDYPSALTLRPVLPTLMVAFFRLWTSDPVLIFRLLAGFGLATLAGAMFFAAHRLWGRAAAHSAALLTLSCPALTTYLIDNNHPYSHLGAMPVLGLALALSLWLLKQESSGQPASTRYYALCGLLWGLCYLCRSELVLYAGVLAMLLAWQAFRRRTRGVWSRLGALLLVFGFIFVPYNIYAEHVTRRDGTSIRKSIYGFYMSQGWADPPPGELADTEGDGYIYAIKLYGDPVANGESMLTAIRHNPQAFLRRVKLNSSAFYALYHSPDFYPAAWAAGDLILLGLLLTGLLPVGDRPCLLFLCGLFLASHFVLMFHIDERYLTIGVPPLILLLAGLIHYVIHASAKLSPTAGIATGLIVAGVLVGVGHRQYLRVRNHRPANTQSIAAMKSFGRHFLAVVKTPRLAGNREPHVGFDFPNPTRIYLEDQFLLPYFSHTALVAHNTVSAYPRPKFYSFREVPDDYLYVPAELFKTLDPKLAAKAIDEYDNPVLGHYYLLELNR